MPQTQTAAPTAQVPPAAQIPDRPLRKDAERNRKRILDAARELFAQQGLGVTLNDVAHHAGVGVGTVYRRFPEKGELIEELFEQQIAQLVALVEGALADPDPWRGLTGFLRGNLEMQARDRAFREIILGTPEGAERVGRIRERMFPLAAKLVQRAKDSGTLREDFQPEDVPMLLMMLTSLVDSARDVEPDLWRRYVEIVIQGLRADPAPPEPLAVSALEPAQVPSVMACFKLPRR
jgi:AcrR family transcriptional regulator